MLYVLVFFAGMGFGVLCVALAVLEDRAWLSRSHADRGMDKAEDDRI